MLNKSFLNSMILLAGLMSVHANASLITNGSFEEVPTGSSLFGNLATQKWAVFSELPGWKLIKDYGPGIEVQRKDLALKDIDGVLINNDLVDGKYYLEMDSHFDASAPGNSNAGIVQLLTGLNIGQTYELSFWYRARDITASDNNGLNVYWKANGSVIDKSNADYTYDYNAADNNHLNWVNYKKKLVASSTEMLIGFGGAGEALHSSDTNKTGGGNGKGALLDMVSLVAVPAPGTIALFGLAGLALLSRRRKV